MPSVRITGNRKQECLQTDGSITFLMKVVFSFWILPWTDSIESKTIFTRLQYPHNKISNKELQTFGRYLIIYFKFKFWLSFPLIPHWYRQPLPHILIIIIGFRHFLTPKYCLNYFWLIFIKYYIQYVISLCSWYG